MLKTLGKSWVILVAAAALTVGSSTEAGAVDAPKWVASLYVEAQKMVGLRWIPVGGATGYKVLRSTTSGSGYAEIASVPTPQYFDKEVEAGTDYFYVLQAVAGAEVSPNSAEKKVTIPGVKVKKILPPVIDEARLTTQEEIGKTIYRVGLLWGGVPGAIAYNVYRSMEAGKDYQLITSTTEPRLIDSDVKTGTTYYYVVSALDQAFQETPFSEEKAVEVKAVEIAAGVKKVYPKLVPIPSKKGNTRKLPSDPFDLLLHDGNLIVAATRLYRLDGIEGELQDITPEGVNSVISLGVGLYGEILFTALNTNIVYILDGSRLKQFTIPPLEKPLINSEGNEMPIRNVRPIDITQNVDGKFWVTDNSNNRVLIFEEDFTFIGHAAAGTEYELIPNVTSINHDSQGNVFASCGGVNYVNIYDAEGNWTGQFGETGNIAGTFARIGGIFVDSSDTLWITDMFNTTVQRFDNTGKFLGALSSEDKKGGLGLATPNAVAFDAGGKDGYITQGIDKSVVMITIVE